MKPKETIAGPSEILEEARLGYQQLVDRGVVDALEANQRLDEVRTMLTILHNKHGVPMETGSTQVRELRGELAGRRNRLAGNSQ